MLQRVLDVGERIELKEFARAGQVLASRVQVNLKVLQFSSQLFVSLLLVVRTHERWVHREVDLKVELKFLADKVLLSEHDGNMAVPKSEEVFALARIKCLAHLLDALRAVLGETAL